MYTSGRERERVVLGVDEWRVRYEEEEEEGVAATVCFGQSDEE